MAKMQIWEVIRQFFPCVLLLDGISDDIIRRFFFESSLNLVALVMLWQLSIYHKIKR